MRRRRRTNCSRGRLLDMHDGIRAGVSRRVDMRAYISRAADDYFEARANALGITKSGLAGLVLEAAAVGDLAAAILDLPIISNVQENRNATDN
jgi:hypothetical protein